MAKKKAVAQEEVVNVGDLGEVSALSRQLIDAEDAVEKAEEFLKIIKESERRIREESLPAAMEELGLKKITLSTGEVISTKLEVYASISEAMKGPAYSWLEAHNFGGLIKSEVTAEFNRDQLEDAKLLLQTLEEQEMSASMKQAVNPQTLKAWLREQLALADEVPIEDRVPMELFGARAVTQAKVKRV